MWCACCDTCFQLHMKTSQCLQGRGDGQPNDHHEPDATHAVRPPHGADLVQDSTREDEAAVAAAGDGKQPPANGQPAAADDVKHVPNPGAQPAAPAAASAAALSRNTSGLQGSGNRPAAPAAAGAPVLAGLPAPFARLHAAQPQV